MKRPTSVVIFPNIRYTEVLFTLEPQKIKLDGYGVHLEAWYVIWSQSDYGLSCAGHK